MQDADVMYVSLHGKLTPTAHFADVRACPPVLH